MKLSAVRKHLSGLFKSGWTSVNDDPRSGCASTLHSEESVTRVCDMIHGNTVFQWWFVQLRKKLTSPTAHATILTQDLGMTQETWVYRSDPDTKHQSSQWSTLSSPQLKKARQVRSNVKMILQQPPQINFAFLEIFSPVSSVNLAEGFQS